MKNHSMYYCDLIFNFIVTECQQLPEVEYIDASVLDWVGNDKA